MFKLLIVSLLIAFSSPASSTESEVLAAEARVLAKTLGGQLKQQLQVGMKQAGPLLALDICNAQAAVIAATVSDTSSWSVGRTSLKPRQENNRPDTWEILAMLEFEKQRDAGANIQAMETYAIIETKNGSLFRYMKAIPTAGLCLACHGEKVNPEVLAKINQLYPMDQAVGFNEGDIRGAFTLSKKLD